MLTNGATDRAELRKIPEHARLEFGNNVYRIKFDTRHRPGVDYYGHRYHFYLEDAVEDVPEFVVYWPNFETCVSLALPSRRLGPIFVLFRLADWVTASQNSTTSVSCTSASSTIFILRSARIPSMGPYCVG